MQTLSGRPPAKLETQRGLTSLNVVLLQHRRQRGYSSQESYGFLFQQTTMSSVQGLAGLFQAPADLLYQGTFDEARNEAQEKQQWLVGRASLSDGPQSGGVMWGKARSQHVPAQQRIPWRERCCRFVPWLNTLSSKLTGGRERQHVVHHMLMISISRQNLFRLKLGIWVCSPLLLGHWVVLGITAMIAAGRGFGHRA